MSEDMKTERTFDRLGLPPMELAESSNGNDLDGSEENNLLMAMDYLTRNFIFLFQYGALVAFINVYTPRYKKY